MSQNTRVSPVRLFASEDCDPHSHKSTLRERIVEHIFVGEALKLLWPRITDVEVLRPEFDAHGYDIVMARRKVVRHIQLKTGTTKGPGNISVPLALAEKQSGCVLWIGVDKELRIQSYYWFGGSPGEPLPSIAQYNPPQRATHNKAGDRPLRNNHRLVPKGQFQPLGNDLMAVLKKLFGATVDSELNA